MPLMAGAVVAATLLSSVAVGLHVLHARAGSAGLFVTTMTGGVIALAPSPSPSPGSTLSQARRSPARGRTRY